MGSELSQYIGIRQYIGISSNIRCGKNERKNIRSNVTLDLDDDMLLDPFIR